MEPDQLRLLNRYVNQQLKELTQEIFDGAVTPNPYTRGNFGSCSYCPYRSVCHLDLGACEVRSLKATSAKDFWQRLTQKEVLHG